MRRHLLLLLVLILLLVLGFLLLINVTDIVNESDKSQSHVSVSERSQLLKVRDYSNDTTKRQCYAERDMGIISAVPQAAKTFCADGGWDRVKQGPVSPKKATKVTMFRVNGGLRCATFENLMLDFVGVKIHSPISNMALDGSRHDPRFDYNPRLINCACDELANYFKSINGQKKRRAKQIWLPALRFSPEAGFPSSTMCSPKNGSSWDFVKNPLQAPDLIETVVFENPVVLIARRDDHNPFFQVSSAFNAWVMLKGLGWNITTTHVIHLDGGYPSPIDALHQGLLAPNHDIIDGASLKGKRVHFRGNVLIASYESSGPLMQHLNDQEPCLESELIKTYRAESLLTQNVTLDMERELGDASIRSMIVTIITRRPYRGRSVQRQWVNEDEIIAMMRTEYKAFDVLIRSIDFVNLTLVEQMKTTLESDMIIGMHGAGLVNVLWARPVTTVVEIFPKKRYRWGFRNLCQFLGCDWHGFRGGEDVNGDETPNSKDKRIVYDEWMKFFDPLFYKIYGALKEHESLNMSIANNSL